MPATSFIRTIWPTYYPFPNKGHLCVAPPEKLVSVVLKGVQYINPGEGRLTNLVSVGFSADFSGNVIFNRAVFGNMSGGERMGDGGYSFLLQGALCGQLCLLDRVKKI